MDLTQRQKWAIVGVVVIVLAIALGGILALALNIGPFGAGPGDGGGAGEGETTETPPPTGTVYTQAPSGGDNVTQHPPFTFEIVKIEECGQTCRDVTVTLDNNQNTSATNVSVFTRIYAGNSTAEGDKIWQGTEDVGTMKADGSVTRTQRVELSTSEGFQVKQNDGWITILTTINSDNTTITFKERRDVA